MPLSRYQIRNEYSLADPELYKSADKDDPEALLEGVAMAGLVGILRQLGDLAEFAAEIFHDLHEEVMSTAARGHGLIGRVQQLEAEFPSIEKRLLSQISHTSFLYNTGFDWHPNLHSDENVITKGDLPRFVMDSYEECRGPPRLFLLDKFDVAGAGACLKRYTDPSCLKGESASTKGPKSECRREKRTRKVKRRGARGRNGETPYNFSSHAKLHQLLLEERIENSVNDLECRVRLKKRQLDASRFDGTGGKSYMEKFLRSSLNTGVCEVPLNLLPLTWEPQNATESGPQVVEIGTVSCRPARESLQTDEIDYASSRDEELVKSSIRELNEVTDKDIMEEPHKTYESDEQKLSSIHGKMRNGTKLFVDADKKSESSLDRYHSDDVASEVDSYVDALAIMESEFDTDTYSKTKRDFLYSPHLDKIIVDSDKSEARGAPNGDTQSIGNSAVSDDGDNYIKKDGSSFSCSDSMSNFVESTPDGDGTATARSSSVASLTDHGDVYSDRQSIYKESRGNYSQESAVGKGQVVNTPKTDNICGSPHHAGLSFVAHPSDTGANPAGFEAYTSGAPEGVSREADERFLSRNVDVACEISAEEYAGHDIVGGDSHKPFNGLQQQRESSPCFSDDSVPGVFYGSGDGSSVCLKYAKDGRVPNLTDGEMFSSHTSNSPAEKSKHLSSSREEGSSSVLLGHEEPTVSLLKHQDEKDPDDSFVTEADRFLCARLTSQSLPLPLNTVLSETPEEQSTDLNRVGRPESCEEAVLCTTNDRNVRYPSVGSDIEDGARPMFSVVSTAKPSPSSDGDSCILLLDSNLPAGGLIDSTICGLHGIEPAVGEVVGASVHQVVNDCSVVMDRNGDSVLSSDPIRTISQKEQLLIDTTNVAPLLQRQLDESGNAAPVNDPNKGDKPVSACGDEVDLNVNATDCELSFHNVPTTFDGDQSDSGIHPEDIFACDHSDGKMNNDASSLDSTSKHLGNAVSVSASKSDPAAEGITEKGGKSDSFTSSSRGDCLALGPTTFDIRSLLQDEDVSPKEGNIQELPPLVEVLAAGEVANQVVDTHLSLGYTNYIVSSEYPSSLRSLDKGSLSSSGEIRTNLEDDFKIADPMFSEKSTHKARDALDSFGRLEQMRSTQHIDKDIWVHSEPGSAPSVGQIFAADIIPGSSDNKLNFTDPGMQPSISIQSCSSVEKRYSQGLEGREQDTNQRISNISLPGIFPSAAQANVGEAPPLPPLPPMQWRLGKVQHTSLASGGKVMQHPFAGQGMSSLPASDKTAFASLPTKWENPQYVNPFSAAPVVENVIASQTHMGCESQYINPFLTCATVENTDNSALAGSSGIQPALQDTFLLSSPPVLQHDTPKLDEKREGLLCFRSENGLQASEAMVSLPSSKPMNGELLIEDVASSNISASNDGKMIQPEASISDEHGQHITSDVDQEVSSPCAYVEPRMTLLYEQQLPAGFMSPEGDRGWSSYHPDAVEAGNFNGVWQKKLPRPRNPLIDAVVALDKSKLRKVGERTKPQDLPKDEGDILNHVQLRKVGERVRISDVPKPEEGELRNHVQLRRVVERVKPQDLPKAIERDSLNHVQLRKVEERVKPEHEPKAEDSLNHVQLRKVGEWEEVRDEPKATEDSSRLPSRKVGEGVKPQDGSQPDDRDSLLEQIRNQSFHLKPAVVTRPTIPGRTTNLKVAAILEKASNIRQAMAGSDEEDSDSWSDS